MKAATSRVLLVLSAFLAGLVVFFAVILIVTGRNPAPVVSAAANIGGPFRLTDQDGKPITEQDLKGRPFLVFFGFTHCPDVCPTTLFQISEILKAAGQKGRPLRALFISVDPERDRPEVLKSYLASFDPRITGLTGDPAAVEAAVKAYRAYARKVPTKDGDYTMEHTAYVYLRDRRNRFVSSVNLNRPPEDVAGDLLKQI